MGEREADERTDGELLLATAADPEAFGVLYDRHSKAVLTYLYRRTACPHTAADLTAETFAKALLGRGRFRSDQGSARPWLFGIAKHELSGFLRRRYTADRAIRRLGMTLPSLDDDSIERIESMVDAAGFSRALRTALSEMPDGMAQAVVLRVAHDLSFEEVAGRLGCSLGAARVRVCRGLLRLGHALEVGP
jgi:RNA polymerase sigma-70 factor (ECF subfamily)